MKELSWIPKRKGKIYCSPACGFNCTFLAYTITKKKAESLCNALGADKWTPDINENMGWHYHVTSGPITLSPDRGGGTTAFFNGSGYQFVVHGKNPSQALRNLLSKAKAAANELDRAIETIGPQS